MMTDRIKKFFAKIKTRLKQDRCYNRMEAKGIAVFGMCCGIKYNDMRLPLYAKQCTTCRYFTPIHESLKVERSDSNDR